MGVSIQTINADDQITSSRADINTNFANLNDGKIDVTVISTDTTLSDNSDSKIPSQKAVKAYIDAGGASDFPSSFVTTSAGAADSGKGIKLNASGFIDETAIPIDYVKTVVITSGITTHDISSTTTKTIAHGLGVVPKRVQITGSVVGTNSSDTVTNAYTVYTNAQSSVTSAVTTGTETAESVTADFRFWGRFATDMYNVGTVTVDATNISISWSKTSTPTGTAQLVWTAEGYTV